MSADRIANAQHCNFIKRNKLIIILTFKWPSLGGAYKLTLHKSLIFIYRSASLKKILTPIRRQPIMKILSALLKGRTFTPDHLFYYDKIASRIKILCLSGNKTV